MKDRCLDVEYNEYECSGYCHQDGCSGHTTDEPIGVHIKGVFFIVEGFEGGDYPGASGEDVDNVKAAIAHLEEHGVESE